MSTAPPLSLTREQVGRVQAYLQTYRRYAFATLMPSVERNTTLRILQAIQGKLIDALDQKTALLQIVLTTEEWTMLKGIIAELLLLYAGEAESAERNAILVDLAAFKNNLKGI